jgi:iron complex outermembrane receptor protein
VRHTQLSRRSIGTDGSGETSYRQSFTTPWLAASYAFAPDQMVYASWGRGVESDVAPNLPRFANRGQALPALASRQSEIGIKGGLSHASWSLAWFDIVRPLFADIGACDVDASCTHQVDGRAHHRGVEASGAWKTGPWTLNAGAQWLRARREGGQDAALDGLRPTNVPAFTLKLRAAWRMPTVEGLELQGGAVHESARMALPDNSAQIPGYTVFDAGLRYETRRAGGTWTLRAGIDNLFDRRAWRESPYQFGHAYLFPLAPRTLRVSLQVDL